MTLRTPPSWLQNGSHPAENDRLTTQALYATTGIIGTSSLAVTQNSPVAMSVRVALGWAAIVGTTQSNMGTYVIYNDATDVLTITAADPTNPRIDRVVATVQDAYYTGSANDVIFQVVAGTPAGSPVAPATPANSISLATVAVAAAATQIVTANITDTRVSTTTNLAVGDITEVQGGTGITVTNGTGPIPTVAISSAVVTLTGSQTLTNKTLTAPVISTISNTGTLTLPTSTDTIVGRATTDTLSNKSLISPEERIVYTATAATGTVNLDVISAATLYYVTNATGNWTLNVRGDGSTTLNSILATNDSITVVFLNTNGSPAYYATALQIDGNAVTPKWQGGSAPTAGSINAVDAYVYTIIKNANASFIVLASQTKFA